MPDLRDADPTRAAPPRNAALVRVVANRLAEQTSTWDRRPPAASSRPAWPTDLTAKPQPEGGHPAPLPVDPATPIELPRSALAQPGLTAGSSAPESSQQSTMSSPEIQPRGEGNDRSGLPVGALARGTSVQAPATLVPDLPRTAAEWNDSRGESIRTRPSGRSTTSAEQVPSVSSNLGSVSGLGALPRGRTGIDPGPGGEALPPTPPGVRAHLATMMPGLTMAAPASAEGAALGMGGGFRSGTEGDGGDFSFQASAGGGGGTNSTIDLSKTNELLQQVLDAVRQRSSKIDSSLPNGGSPVYAERL